MFTVLKERNPNLLDEDKDHILELGLITERRYINICEKLHKILVSGFKLVDENNCRGGMWIKCDNNNVFKYGGFRYYNKNHGNNINLMSVRNNNQYGNATLINQ